MKFVGSVCLSEIPREEIKKVKCADGVERLFVNISVHENAEPKYIDKVVNGVTTKVLVSDHFISCAPKKEERKEGVNYIVGNLRTWTTPTAAPSPADIAAAPSVADNGVKLPWE